jgi:hypothetical protein
MESNNIKDVGFYDKMPDFGLCFFFVFFYLKPKKILLNYFILNIIGIIKIINPYFHKKTSFK